MDESSTVRIPADSDAEESEDETIDRRTHEAVVCGLFLTRGERCDLKVGSSEGKQFDAHWLALASALHCFRANIKTPTIFLDASDESTEFILKWVYGEGHKVDLSFCACCELGHLAMQWNVPDLACLALECIDPKSLTIFEIVACYGWAVAVDSCDTAKVFGHLIFKRRNEIDFSEDFALKLSGCNVPQVGLWGINVLLTSLVRLKDKSLGRRCKTLTQAPKSSGGLWHQTVDLAVLTLDGKEHPTNRLFWLDSPLFSDELKKPETKVITVSSGNPESIGLLVKIMNGESVPCLTGSKFKEIYSLAADLKLCQVLDGLEKMCKTLARNEFNWEKIHTNMTGEPAFLGRLYELLDILVWSSKYPHRRLGCIIVANAKYPDHAYNQIDRIWKTGPEIAALLSLATLASNKAAGHSHNKEHPRNALPIDVVAGIAGSSDEE